ncbi:MAG: hypothetical protein IBX57_09585 [Gammaproteobacteria bacterium]|nr:hypothetical protein [Gammaproteobacteria bacterium]
MRQKNSGKALPVKQQSKTLPENIHKLTGTDNYYASLQNVGSISIEQITGNKFASTVSIKRSASSNYTS